MKTTFILIYTLLIINTLAYSQRNGRWGNAQDFNPEEVAQRQTKLLKDSLNLSAEQEKKVQEINLKYAQKGKKLMADSLTSQMERAQEFQTQRENRNYEIKKVLSKEQVKKYNQMQERMRTRQRRPNNNGQE